MNQQYPRRVHALAHGAIQRTAQRGRHALEQEFAAATAGILLGLQLMRNPDDRARQDESSTLFTLIKDWNSPHDYLRSRARIVVSEKMGDAGLTKSARDLLTDSELNSQIRTVMTITAADVRLSASLREYGNQGLRDQFLVQSGDVIQEGLNALFLQEIEARGELDAWKKENGLSNGNGKERH